MKKVFMLVAATCMLLFFENSILFAADYLVNGRFDSGQTGWNFYTNGGGDFAVIGLGGNNIGRVRITGPAVGSNVQLYQSGISLEAGTYRLSFMAYSNTGHGAQIFLMKHTAPYTDYGLSASVDLTTSWQYYELEFNAPPLVSDARLAFYFPNKAAVGDQYFFDDIYLEKITPSENRILEEKSWNFPSVISYECANRTICTCSKEGAVDYLVLGGGAACSEYSILRLSLPWGTKSWQAKCIDRLTGDEVTPKWIILNCAVR